MIAVDIQEDQATASKFASDNGWGFPVALDKDGSAARVYGVQGIPTTFVLDPQGRVARRFVGAVDEATFLSALDGASK